MASSNDLQIIRTLYKACLLAAKRVSTEVTRHRTADVFLQSETEWLQAHLPAVLSAVAHGEESLRMLIRTEFRHQALVRHDEKHVGERLDLGFAALRLINHRCAQLEKQAVESISDKTTNGVRVVIQSEPCPENLWKYVYAYKVKIRNESFPQPVMLVFREWKIMDDEGNETLVSGPGVVGKQPIMETGGEFTYTSYTTLKSRRGTLAGTYYMIATDTMEFFHVPVGPLALSPSA